MIKSISIPQVKIMEHLVWKGRYQVNNYKIMNTSTQSSWTVLIPVIAIRQSIIFEDSTYFKKALWPAWELVLKRLPYQEQISRKVVIKEIPKFLVILSIYKKGGESHIYYINQNWWVLFTFINTAQDDMKQAVHNTALIYMLCNPLCFPIFFKYKRTK